MVVVRKKARAAIIGGMAVKPKRGRKRKSGKREPNGRAQRQPAVERGWDNLQTVLRTRCRHRGLPPTHENLVEMRDPREGYVLGRLWKAEAITQGQHDAGVRHAKAYMDWARSSGLAIRQTAAVSSYGLRIAGTDVVDQDRAEATQARYYAAARALTLAGMLAERQVMAVCLRDEEPENLAALSNGLDALREHFGT